MKRFPLLAVIAAALAALSLGLAACGDDDSGESTTTAATTTAAPATTAPATTAPATTAPATTAATTAAVTKLALEADPSGALKYVQTTLTAPPGGVEITLTNDSPVPHDVSIEGKGKSEVISGGESSTLKIANLPAGTYTYFCTVPGHQAAGMEGTLTVE